MMDKISDVTRQDIIDVIRNGFVVSFDEPQYDSISGNYIVSYRAKISYHGRLDELGFLERLYDLDNMPSNDSRYSNAHGDISCHLRFGDYEDEYWIFQDERFSLRQGDGDEALLHFLCMMLHPSVRIENSQFTPVPVIYTNDRVTLSSLESENLDRDTMKIFVERAELPGGFAQGGGELMSPNSTRTPTGTLQWPLPVAGTITSQFGHCVDPITGEINSHTGTDIACAEGGCAHPCRRRWYRHRCQRP
mgnify:CR=1 FL=1